MRQTLKTSSHWSGDYGQCMNPGCAVDTCDDQELPDFLRGKTSTFVLQSTTQRGSSLSGLGPAVHSVPSPAFNLSLPFIESNIKTKMCIWFLKKCVNKEIVLTKWFYRKHLYSCLLNISVRRLIVHPSFRVVGDFQAENLLFKNTQPRLGHERVKWVRGRGDCQC